MRVTFKVRGMHCRSCEILLEDEIRKLPGVESVSASYKRGTLQATGKGDFKSKIKETIRRAGYKVVNENEGNESASAEEGRRISDLLFAALAVALILILFRSIDLGTLLNPASFASSNLAAIFTIGLTAGISSCMALVGGLVLGLSTRFAERHPQSTAGQKFRPHLFFNLGRLLSFFVLGGLLGEVGSFFKLSGPLLGSMIVVVGVVMFFLGLQITELFPKLSTITLPKIFSGFRHRKDREYSHRNSIILGALTFFLPCGFTQAAQIYAVSTGSFWRGGLVMFFFALGTLPGLLSIGGLTSLIKRGRFASIAFKAIGIIIIILSFYNFKNGLNLLNVRFPAIRTEIGAPQKKSSPAGPKATTSGSTTGTVALENGVQVIKATYTPLRSGSQFVITPRDFTVKVNTPVRLEVFASGDGEGCMGSITLPGLVNDFRIFAKGETATFSFVPAMTGEYQITCAMGIPMGTIEVIN